MASGFSVTMDVGMDCGDRKRVKIGDFIVLPMYKWYQVKDVGTVREFKGWYAFSITRGYPDAATPWTSETLGGLPHELYASPEEAAQAAENYVAGGIAAIEAAKRGGEKAVPRD